MAIGDFLVASTKDVDLFFREVSLMKQLILERTHPLELLRELISNSGAQEVGATHIHITYFVHPRYGHAFEVSDNGCGMNFTNNPQLPGRLDRFLGLGLSAIAGLKSDEFAWKGLGSKLAYNSRRIEIDTITDRTACSVVVNEPWGTIEDGKKPRPVVAETPVTPGQQTGTTVRVFGHPPHRRENPFTFEEIRDYLTHRTFVGFTQKRPNPPRITLTVQSRTEDIPFGHPELTNLPATAPEGTVIIDPPVVISRNLPGSNQNVQISLKGFYTWDERNYGLADVHLNTGLVLSVRGIPYFALDLRKLGSGELAVARPGIGKCCLIVECDAVQAEMNISRSDIVDSALAHHFKKLVTEAIQKVEKTEAHRVFRKVPEIRKDRTSAKELRSRKQGLESPEQAWVYWQANDTVGPVRLLRKPENETDTMAILWKLEALNALPFANFETLAYSGKGADLVVHFQEDETSNPERYATMEAEYRFYNFQAHKHLIPQFPTVICWDINPQPRLSVQKTSKPYKFVVHLEETTLRIYALSQIPGVFVANEEEMKRKRANKTWASNL